MAQSLWDEWQSYIGKGIPLRAHLQKSLDGEGVSSKKSAKADH
jgi:hypothetical protein